MAALQEVRLEAMISASNAADAAIIEAFAGIAALLDQTPGRDTMGLQAGGPGVFKGDLYFYRVDGDLRGRVERINTKVCPLFLLTGEYDFSCTPEDTNGPLPLSGAPVSPSWSSSVTSQ